MARSEPIPNSQFMAVLANTAKHHATWRGGSVAGYEPVPGDSRFMAASSKTAKLARGRARSDVMWESVPNDSHHKTAASANTAKHATWQGCSVARSEPVTDSRFMAAAAKTAKIALGKIK